MPPRFTLATLTGTATCRWPPGAPWPLGLFCAGGAPVLRQPAINGTARKIAPNLRDIDGRVIGTPYRLSRAPETARDAQAPGRRGRSAVSGAGAIPCAVSS